MRILVLGLCLQGNKGGPAIALALLDQLRPRLPEQARFVFSVPAGESFVRELRWAHGYGVEVVEDLTPRDLLPTALFDSHRALRPARWLSAVLAADLVIEMSAISYVGPPAGSGRVLREPRVRYFLTCRALGKPMLAWTQSYGPFSTPLIRRLARQDLGRQPVVFCRGEETRRMVSELLPGKPCESFPDVATTLRYDPKLGADYLERYQPGLDRERLVTISPSAVVGSHPGAEGDAGGALLHLARHLLDTGFSVLFVPHTYRPDEPDLRLCDHALSRSLLARLGSAPRVSMVEPDICATELKAIISCARLHVGERYHSVVAALSSGVPCLSLSWHHKYRDIMRMYGCEEFVWEALGGRSSDGLVELFGRLDDRADEVRRRLAEAQLQVVEQVARNASLFVDQMS